MKYYMDLLNDLKQGNIYPVYLFCGEETYLRELAVRKFREALAGNGEQNLNYELIDGEETTYEGIVASAETHPFIGYRRLIVVRNPFFLSPAVKAPREVPAMSGTRKKKMQVEEDHLLEYIRKPMDTTCLIFSTGAVVDKRRRIYQEIKRSGRVVEFARLHSDELRRWLGQRARKAGKKFTQGAEQILLSAAGPSMQRLVLEFAKLDSYTGNKEVISREDVRQVCIQGTEDNIFEIVDAIGNGDCKRALEGIKELLAKKEPPLKILAMIVRQIRLLLQANELLNLGCQPGELAVKLKVHPYTARKAVSQSNNFDRASLLRFHEMLLELDLLVKSGRQEFYPVIETFILKICCGLKHNNNHPC